LAKWNGGCHDPKCHKLKSEPAKQKIQSLF